MAHREGARLGLAVWNQDEAGPYQAIPQGGHSWQPMGQAARQPHEYERGGTAKLLTLLHPATGTVRVKGVISSANVVLHPWLQEQLSAIVEDLPPAGPVLDQIANRAQWERWQEGLTEKFTLMEQLPPLRMLLIWDNLAGHKTPELVCWLMRHGIMPLYTPLGGSWLNMAESVQRILTRRALAGEHPRSSGEIIAWLEATARAWNRQPTPFVWGGARHARRERARQRRRAAHPALHALGGSGACSAQPIVYAKAA
jgi:DDE superfamily endonuclease